MEVEKKPRVALDIDEAKEAAVSISDHSKSMPSVSVSTSESSAKFMIYEDELESSSPKMEKIDKLESGKPNASAGEVKLDKCDCSPEFSIRNYVFAARVRDISMTWPFSQKNLQFCLSRGVKNVLPPFHPTDNFKESSTKRCSVERSLHIEEINLADRSSMQKNHKVPSATMDRQWSKELGGSDRDSASFPSGADKDLAFKSCATANSHSEVESVSTSNLPLSEVLDEREAAASASNNGVKNNRLKRSASQLSSKKCRLSVKMPMSSSRNSVEDITSACTLPSDAMASKICPVCETFSSWSNTTLNAHIDQCLSSQSSPNWAKDSKLIRPRIKPRKMRSMIDICATAPCCTLEDLDRRNGTHWATNTEFPSELADVVADERSCGVASRFSVNTSDNGAVYIDSHGRKIRIISKLDASSSPSLPKAKEDRKTKKKSRKSKTSNIFAQNRKRRLAKHLKYLKASRQRKRFSSLKAKDPSSEACGAADEGHIGLQQAPHVKSQEQSNAEGSGASKQWISSNRPSLSNKKLEDANKQCRYRLRTTKDPEAGSDQPDTGGIHIKKNLSSPKKSLVSTCRETPPAAYRAGTDQRSEVLCEEKTVNNPSLRGEMEGKQEPILVRLKVAAARLNQDTEEAATKSMDSTVTPPCPLEREAEIQAYAAENADRSLTGSRKLLDSSHLCSSEALRTPTLKANIHSRTHEICYADVVGVEKLELEAEVSDFDVRHESSFLEVDPIPIPGPPGSELPSFSDMGSDLENSWRRR